MSGQDAELDLFRNGVNCAALLERLPPPWVLDRKGSTRRALKYRRGAGEVLIVNHDGRGWWDTQSSAKGDIFDLVQFLDPSLNFGQVRQVLRPFVGHCAHLSGSPAKEEPADAGQAGRREMARPPALASRAARHGDTSPTHGACRLTYSRPPVPQTRCAMAPTAAPGLPIATTVAP